MISLRGAAAHWLALAVVLVSCRPLESSGNPAEQVASASVGSMPMKRITVAIASEPPSLSNLETNPPTTIGSLAGTEELQELVHVGLVNLDDRGNPRALLAEEVPSTENGLWKVLSDGRMETTWRLRRDAAWHDGTPFTAEDLLFTGRVKRDKEVPIFRSTSLDLIEGIDAPDLRAVTVRWRGLLIEAHLMFSKFLAIPLPKHLLEDDYSEDKATLTQLRYWNEAFVGTGPYRIRQWVLGSHALLEANESYVLGQPRIAEIEVKFIASPETVITSVLAGAVDFPIGRGIDLEQALAMKDQRPDLKVAFTAGSLAAVYPQFVDPNPPVVAQRAFRRAALHAIDRQELSDTITHGLSQVAHSFVQPDQPGYGEVERSMVVYGYDPRRATQLIEELGYTMGPEGVFRDGAGQKLAVEIRTTAQAANRNAVFPVAQYWQRAGIAADPLVVPVQRAADREYRVTFPAFEYTSGRTGLGSARLKLFHSSAAGLRENRFQASGNYARYMNPVLDDLIEQYVSTIPMSSRLKVLGQILQHQSEHVTLLGLFYSLSPSIAGNKLEGVTRGLENTVASNAHLWDVRE